MFGDKHDAGFARVRDISAMYTLPRFLTDRIGASRATLSLAARNLWFVWRAEAERYGRRIPDPEAGNFSSQATGAGGNVPYWPSSQLTATMRVSF